MSSAEHKIDELIAVVGKLAEIQTAPQPSKFNWNRIIPVIGTVFAIMVQFVIIIWWAAQADNRITAANERAADAYQIAIENRESIIQVQNDLTAIRKGVESLIETDRRSQIEFAYRRDWMDGINEDVPVLKTTVAQHADRITALENKHK